MTPASPSAASRPSPEPSAATGTIFRSEAGFSLWFPAAPQQLRMTDPATISVSGAIKQGVVFLHVHRKSDNTDAALKAFAEEFLALMHPAPGQTWRPLQVAGAEAAFAIPLLAEALGHELPGELRAARRGGDLVIWGILARPDVEPAARFLSSLVFTEPGVYRDPSNGFRVAIPLGWEFLYSDDKGLLIKRGNPLTEQTMHVSRIEVNVGAATLDDMEAVLLEQLAKHEQFRKLAVSKQLIGGHKTLDVWWWQTSEGRHGVMGERWIVLPDHMVKLQVATPDVDTAPANAQALLESFQPLDSR